MRQVLNTIVASFLWVSFGIVGATFGYGNGDVTIHLNGGDDIAYVGEINTLEIWIANDADLSTITPAFEITFSTGLTWEMGYGDHAPVNEEGRAVGRFDLTGLVVNNDFDDTSPDHVVIKGVAWTNPLPAGPSAKCYTLQFYIPPTEPGAEDGISIVPYVYPPVDFWSFQDDMGAYPPDFNGTPVASQSDPVAPPATFDVVRRTICGDSNCDGTRNISDAVHIINWIFKGGPAPCETCP